MLTLVFVILSCSFPPLLGVMCNMTLVCFIAGVGPFHLCLDVLVLYIFRVYLAAFVQSLTIPCLYVASRPRQRILVLKWFRTYYVALNQLLHDVIPNIYYIYCSYILYIHLLVATRKCCRDTHCFNMHPSYIIIHAYHAIMHCLYLAKQCCLYFITCLFYH
jgi:hypothetical protein